VHSPICVGVQTIVYHKVDMQAGVNAGIPVWVGVSHGFDGEEVLKKAGATQVIHSLDELPILL